jgi:hypothetical protein
MTVCLNLPSLTHDAFPYGNRESAHRHGARVCNGRFKINGLGETGESLGNGSLRNTRFFQIKDG